MIFCTSLYPGFMVGTQIVFIAGAVDSVLPLFLTLISLIFEPDHMTQRTLGVSQ